MITATIAHARADLESWLAAWLTRELRPDAGPLDPATPFLAYGMDSIQAMMLVGDLETALGRPLPPTLAWDHPSISALAHHLHGLVDDAAPSSPATEPGPGGLDPREAEDLLARLDELSEDQVDALLRRYSG